MGREQVLQKQGTNGQVQKPLNAGKEMFELPGKILVFKKGPQSMEDG